MKKSNLQKLLKSGFAIAVIAFAAFPLSGLLVAKPQVSELKLDTVQEQIAVEDASSTDAVSALMAGNVVGRSRDCSFGLRRPASAFVP